MTSQVDSGANESASVLVVGCGLIGTSVALGLRNLGHRVFLEDASAVNVALAQSVGAGTSADADNPGFVVIAVPPGSVVAAAEDALGRFPNAIVTDVASVKGPIVNKISDSRFVGGHPMAGKERSGPMAASGQLFEGRAWAIVPREETDPTAIESVQWLAERLGAVTKRMDAESHDQAVALVSHVPHLVSVLTASLLNGAPSSHLELAGQGLRDVTRIAGSEAGLWLDIIGNNSEPVGALLSLLRDELDRLISLVSSGDSELVSMLDRGREGTRMIPGKHGGHLGDVVPVFVPIDDTPGELSRLVTDTGVSGVNIEDLRIDHELGRPVGLVEIIVLADRADVLVRSLRAVGWAAYR